MARTGSARAEDLELVLHIGLHKTASTYVQNVLSARRHDLLRHGVLYPTTGTLEDARIRTRDGAQSGHIRLTFQRGRKKLLAELLDEVPATASTVLLSAEDFTHLRRSPEQHLEHLGVFGSLKVVVVLRRQDLWIKSMYKQAVDQWANFETRSFPDFVAEMGPRLLDLHQRLSPWRELVGPESFHALSYDDLAGGEDILRRILRISGVSEDRLAEYPGIEVPRYDSVRDIDTLGLRILNGYRLGTRDLRNATARDIYAAAPQGDIEVMTPELRAGIQQRCDAVNERIETEWFAEPVPGLRFGEDLPHGPAQPPSGPELVDYVERVIALCDRARRQDGDAGSDPTAQAQLRQANRRRRQAERERDAARDELAALADRRSVRAAVAAGRMLRGARHRP